MTNFLLRNRFIPEWKQQRGKVISLDSKNLHFFLFDIFFQRIIMYVKTEALIYYFETVIILKAFYF